MRSSNSKSAIRAQIAAGLRRPMPPQPILTPQKTDLTSATENMNLDSRLGSQSSTPGRLAPTEAGSSTSHVRGDMRASTSQGEENNDDQLRRLREILMPTPIEGLADWGIPPATTKPCDSALEVCFASALYHSILIRLMARRSSPISTTSNTRKTSISTPPSCLTSPSVTLTCTQNSWSLWMWTKAEQTTPRTCGIHAQG
jgi:hypothetical protein